MDGHLADTRGRTDGPTAINAVLYEGNTCLPPSLAETDGVSGDSCTVGGYPAYAVAATAVYQIQLAVNMARNLDLRLVIKNTGHDFSAKSTGYGALSIWTHKLKSISFISSFSDSTYKGAAMKFGAGVQAYEAYEAANQYGVSVVGGEGQVGSSLLLESLARFINLLIRPFFSRPWVSWVGISRAAVTRLCLRSTAWLQTRPSCSKSSPPMAAS